MEKSYESKRITKNQEAIPPNIFIGLGGEGCRMVAKLAEISKKNKADAKYLGFIAIDTDVNELRKIKNQSRDVVTIQTSSRMTIGEYLKYDDNARENWFPINDIILDKTPSEGAGQVRAISNLVAHNAIREGQFGKINEVIDSLFPLSSDDFQQSIHITIMGSLTGGTGSGLVLPIALYVRNYLEKALQQNSSVIRGFFMLPDVMTEVIKSDEERKNLSANAYAALREIDAFMRRPYDISIIKRYPNLKVVLPKVGGNGYDEFNDKPFDFCFLFNKINVKGTNMKFTEDLRNHAVECIYDMTVSPISAKVNSQEDNILREKINSSNRQSYAGAGASKLVYPYEDVVDYVALNWIDGSISKKWLALDEEVEKRRKEHNKSGSINKFDEDSEYALAVETGKDDIFNASIIEQCHIKESAIKSISKASKYVDEVDKYAANLLNDSIAANSPIRRECIDDVGRVLKRERLEDLDDYSYKEEQKHNIAKNSVNKFKICVDDALGEVYTKADIIASNLIELRPGDVKSSDNQIPILESSMDGEDDFFMHPNAARYFLIKISLELEERIKEYETQRTNEKYELTKDIKELEALAVYVYSQSDERSRIVGPAEKDEMIADIINKWLTGAVKDEDAAGDEDSVEYVTGEAKLEMYCKHIANLTIFKKLKAYIDDIIDGYKEIFGKLANDLNNLDSKIEKIENKFGDQEKIAIKYVCADEVCLKRLAQLCGSTISMGELPGEFTKQFFLKARDYSEKKASGVLAEEYGIYEGCTTEEKKRGLSVFFGDIFEDIILSNWRGYVKEKYERRLDMNAVQAVMQEAVFNECIEISDKFAYLKNTIQDTVQLAAEFIESPKGVQPRPLRTALINEEVEESIGHDAYFVLKESLGDFKPHSAASADKHEIRFFSALYKISANNLKQMRPPMKAIATHDPNKMESAGEYFKVYHERMNKIHPLDSVNTEITPHLQRDWQYINSLPELDDDYQKQYEKRIAKAFVYAIISKKIDYRKKDSSGFNFCYELIDAKIMSPQLVVSNGTYCDQIFEVLDSLSISPAYVERLLELYYEELETEAKYKIDFTESSFIKHSESFVLEEYSKDVALSIFDIPLIYKESAGPEYKTAWGEAIIAAIIEIVDEVVRNLVPAENVENIKLGFLYKLFNEFSKSLAPLEKLSEGKTTSGENGIETRGHSRLKRISHDSITLRICDVVASILEDYDGTHAYSQQHKKYIDEIRAKRRELAE